METMIPRFFTVPPHGVEVDFILYGEKQIIAIEVKNTKKIRPIDMKSLTEFKRDYPQSQLLLLYRGTDRLLRNDILCLPCDGFLGDLTPGIPFLPIS